MTKSDLPHGHVVLITSEWQSSYYKFHEHCFGIKNAAQLDNQVATTCHTLVGANRHHCKAATVASHVALSHAIALIHLVKWVEKRGHPERPKVLIEKSLSDWEFLPKVKAQVGGKTACI